MEAHEICGGASRTSRGACTSVKSRKEAEFMGFSWGVPHNSLVWLVLVKEGLESADLRMIYTTSLTISRPR